MTIRTVHSELITLAAEMVRGEGLPSPYSDDHKWARTTSRTERIKVLRQYEQATEQAKNWAVRLRALADRLSSGGSSDETAGESCEWCAKGNEPRNGVHRIDRGVQHLVCTAQKGDPTMAPDAHPGVSDSR